MDTLWAPWRAEYIQKPGEKDGCVFCLAQTRDPKEALVLFKGAVSLVILNKFPYNSGHLMICPLRHVGKVEDVTPEEGFDTYRLVRHSIAALKKAFNPDGFNVGMNVGKAAGAGIADHLHMHIVPRWNGDMNFMPVLADVKIISEHLLQTYEKLRPSFEHL